MCEIVGDWPAMPLYEAQSRSIPRNLVRSRAGCGHGLALAPPQAPPRLCAISLGSRDGVVVLGAWVALRGYLAALVKKLIQWHAISPQSPHSLPTVSPQSPHTRPHSPTLAHTLPHSPSNPSQVLCPLPAAPLRPDAPPPLPAAAEVWRHSRRARLHPGCSLGREWRGRCTRAPMRARARACARPALS